MTAKRPKGGRGKQVFYRSYVLRIPTPLIDEVRAIIERFYSDIESAQSLPTTGNWWEVLGVKKTASKPQIKKAYLLLVKLFHPDTTKSEETTARFTAICKAYQQSKL